MLYTTKRRDIGRKETDDVSHRSRVTLPTRHTSRQVDSQKVAAALVEELGHFEN